MRGPTTRGLLLTAVITAAAAAGAVRAAAGDGDASDVPDLRTRQTGSDWPGFLGPTGDSRSSETGILTKWPAEGLRLVWKREIGTSYGPPAVALGRLFHFDRHGDRNRLTCVKAETGDELWRFEYPTDYVDMYGFNNGPRCGPVVDADRVYVFGQEGMLHCLSVTDGKVLWKKDTTKQYGVVQNFFGVGAAPIIEGDLLIAQIGGSPPDSPGIQSGAVRGLDSGIVAFDKRTGLERYRLTDELASYATPVTATIDGRRWCFVFARGGLVGFDPTTGKVDFRHPWRAKVLTSVNASTPVVVGDTVFISEAYAVGGCLLRVRPGGYEVVWEDEDRRDLKMATHWMTAIHHEGHLYGASGRHEAPSQLRCVELATGKVIWKKAGLSRVSLLYVDGHLLSTGEDGALRLIEATPDGYRLVAESAPVVKGPAWAAPVLAHGLLYIRGRDSLVCLELIPE